MDPREVEEPDLQGVCYVPGMRGLTGALCGLALLAACGGTDAPPPQTGSGGDGEEPAEERERPPAADLRDLDPDATFADLARAARELDDRRDQDSSEGCLLRRGWHLAADLAVAVRPLAEPPDDLDERLEGDPGAVVVLSRWGMYGEAREGGVALTAVTTTMPPRTEPAILWAVTDRGVYVRHSRVAVTEPGPLSLEQATAMIPADAGALFVTAEAGLPLSRLADVLAAAPDRLTGTVGLAVALAPDTRLPEPPEQGGQADTDGLCPNGLPPLAEGAPVGNLLPQRIVSSLGPLRQGAEICVGATDGPGAAGGRVVLALRIGADGSLAEACVVEEAAPDPSLRACLLRSARSTMFPTPDPPGAVDVQLPLVLAPLDEQRQRPLCD